MKKTDQELARNVGLSSAILLGLGSILGTGVFVSIAIGAGLAGDYIVLALIVAGCLATFNGLSSSQLAAAIPISGGTYEYGYRTLGPSFGFAAGWLFLCAKIASCATAALGSAGYLLSMINITDPMLIKVVASVFTVLITVLVCGGLKRSTNVNTIIVIVTVLALVTYCFVCLRSKPIGTPEISSSHEGQIASFFQACALMFVAYTGYGRIATLGEEIVNPRRNIPLAIIFTLVTTVILYVLVAASSLKAVGAYAFAEAAGHSGAALINVARLLRSDWLALLLTFASITAMIGVQLNLLLGLSRVMLAMGRRSDLPRQLSKIAKNQSPNIAVLTTGFFVLVMVLYFDFRSSWSFSAFTVLIYYAITNLAAIRLQTQDRFVPKIVSWFGLIVCLTLAAYVQVQTMAYGLGILAAGFIFRGVRRRMQSDPV